MQQNQIAEISISYTPSLFNQAIILSTQDAYDILKEFFADYGKILTPVISPHSS